MGTLPYAWSGHDKQGNTKTGSGSVTTASSPQLPYVGTAIQSNGDPASLETFCGRNLGLHRTYYNLGTTGDTLAESIDQAEEDAAEGRVAILSYKLGANRTWSQGLAGSDDAAVQSLNTQLGAIPNLKAKVAIHHEPEGDGPLDQWVALQQRLLPMLTASNVTPIIILTAWDTFFSNNPDQTIAALWPGSMCEGMWFDAYNPYGDANHSNPNRGAIELKTYYDLIAPQAKARGVEWGIAETGYTDVAAAADPNWLTRGFDDMKNHSVQPGDGLSYFSSNINSGTNTWPLGSGVKRDKFKAILNRSRAAG